MSEPIYRGKSKLTGKPIAAVLQAVKGHNRKIGAMDQLWIVPEHPPEQGAKWKDVCGTCPLQGDDTTPRVCYVNLMPVWGIIKRARARVTAAIVRTERPIRLGAFGDPAAVPVSLLRSLILRRRHTGYTHQWHGMTGRTEAAYRGLLMASADTLADARQAWARGWRTFRMVLEGEALQPNEILCPNTTRGITCAQCCLCDGSKGPNDKRKSIAILYHGNASTGSIRQVTGR